MPVDLSIPTSLWRSDLYYFLATVCKLAYNGHPELIDRCLQVPGPCTWQIWSEEPEYVPWALLASYDNWALVALAGSDTPGHWARNAIGVIPSTGTGAPGFVHAFFRQVGLEVAQHVQERLSASPLLAGRNVLLTGHSAGAAIAQVAAFHLHGWNGYSVGGVVCFGSPKVGNTTFARANTWPVVRVNNTFDPIPYVPPGVRFSFTVPVRTLVWDIFCAYQHGGNAWLLNGEGRLSALDPGFFETLDWALLDELLNSGGPGSLIGHWPNRFTDRVRAQLPYDLSVFSTANPRFHQLDEINAAIFSAENERWLFPASYPVAYEPGFDRLGPLGPLRSDFVSGCPGVPGQRCCSDS